MNENSSIDLNNSNNVAICKTCDYKLSCGNNSKIWGMKCIPVHYLVLIPAGFLKNAIWFIPGQYYG